MLYRVLVMCACFVGVVSASAEELAPEQARAFVAGKLFAYTCFDGTARDGPYLPGWFRGRDHSTAGQQGSALCGVAAGHHQGDPNLDVRTSKGLPIEPCFRVQKLDVRSFRGSLSGLGFAYRDFHQRNPRIG